MCKAYLSAAMFGVMLMPAAAQDATPIHLVDRIRMSKYRVASQQARIEPIEACSGGMRLG